MNWPTVRRWVSLTFISHHNPWWWRLLLLRPNVFRHSRIEVNRSKYPSQKFGLGLEYEPLSPERSILISYRFLTYKISKFWLKIIETKALICARIIHLQNWHILVLANFIDWFLNFSQPRLEFWLKLDLQNSFWNTRTFSLWVFYYI